MPVGILAITRAGVFGSENDRQAHINGEIAAALMANADELLATAPEILPADVLAAK